MQIIVILSRKDIRQRQPHQASTSTSRPGFFVCSLASYKANNCPKIGAMQTANVMEQFSSTEHQRQRMCNFNDDIFKKEIHPKTKYRHEALNRSRRHAKVSLSRILECETKKFNKCQVGCSPNRPTKAAQRPLQDNMGAATC